MGTHPGPVVADQNEGQAAVEHAARLLRSGGLVAFPTETVYGLGGNALDAAAVRRIFAVKGRPADNPLIVHVAGIEGLEAVAASVTPLARDLAERFWPGPLTLVVEAAAGLPHEVTGGLGSVAVRVPDHDLALRLLAAAGVPLAAPSANRSGRPSPTTARHVLDDVGDRVDLILDGGPCRVGVESTVVDARGSTPRVYREGAVTREHLRVQQEDAPAGDLRASPGTRYRHYAPDCRVEIIAPGQLHRRLASLATERLRVAVVAPTGVETDHGLRLGSFADAAELAGRLYEWLRAAEEAGMDVVVFSAVPETGIGRAVMDRLRRAAGA